MDLTNIKVFKRAKHIIQKIRVPGPSLSGKTARSTFWLFSLRAADRLFILLRTIILARILAPNDFGVFGVALLVLSIVGSFSQTGYSQALIRKKEKIGPYLDTAWTINIVRGVLIAIALFFIAHPAASFLGAPVAGDIIRVIGLSILFQGFNNIAVLYFHKELKFQKFFKYQFVGTVVDFTVTAAAAYLLRNVWALAIGLIAGALTRLIMSYIIESYRPRIRFIRSQVKELFSFGKWISISGILVFFILHGDDIFVGSILGATMLGYYQMAYKISNTPATESTLVISSVTFPLYAKLQEDPDRLRQVYLRVLQVISLISFPLAGLIIVMAPEITIIFLGEQWMPIVPAVRTLVLAGFMRSIITTAIPVFKALGKPALETRWQAVRLAVIIALIYSLTIRYGILGTSITIAAGSLIAGIGFCADVIRLIRCSVREFLKTLLFPLVNSLAISLSLFFLKQHIDGETITGFILLLLAAMPIFVVISIIFDRFFGYKLGKILKNGMISFIRG